MSRNQHVKSINSDSSLEKNQSMNKMVLLMNAKRRGIELVIFQDVLLCSQAVKKKKKMVKMEPVAFFLFLLKLLLHKTRKQILTHCLKIPRKYCKFLKNNCQGTSLAVQWLRLHLPMQEVWLDSTCILAIKPKHKQQKQYCTIFNRL